MPNVVSTASHEAKSAGPPLATDDGVVPKVVIGLLFVTRFELVCCSPLTTLKDLLLSLDALEKVSVYVSPYPKVEKI